MNKEQLLEQMPKVDIEALIAGRLTLWEKGLHPNPTDLQEYVAQAQREADAKWVVEQGYGQLPDSGQFIEELRRLADKFMLPQLREYAIAITNSLVRLGWVRERG